MNFSLDSMSVSIIICHSSFALIIERRSSYLTVMVCKHYSYSEPRKKKQEQVLDSSNSL